MAEALTSREHGTWNRWLRFLVWVAANGALGLLVGVMWGGLLWSWRAATGTAPFIGWWILYAPAIPLWLSMIGLARKHQSGSAALLGAIVAAPTLVVTQVVAVRLLTGPIEDVGTGGAIILGMLFVGIPVGLIGAIGAAIAAALFGRVHRRRMSGCCVACGYSLSGLASGVCPECGRDARIKTGA